MCRKEEVQCGVSDVWRSIRSVFELSFFFSAFTVVSPSSSYYALFWYGLQIFLLCSIKTIHISPDHSVRLRWEHLNFSQGITQKYLELSLKAVLLLYCLSHNNPQAGPDWGVTFGHLISDIPPRLSINPLYIEEMSTYKFSHYCLLSFSNMFGHATSLSHSINVTQLCCTFFLRKWCHLRVSCLRK